jgi:hypothetical protein
MRKILILAVFGAFATIAPAQGTAEPTPEQKALAERCAAHKFETTVVVGDSGRGKKVKICGKPGQSDADWLVTLKDSASKVAADKAMAQPVKAQIIAALKMEIDKLESASVSSAFVPMAMIELPARPVTVPEAPPQYSSVPPLPAPLPRARGGQASASAAAAPVVKPRLTVRCALPHESFAGCTRLERETRLLIRADEDLAAGISLRFLRGGDTRAELDLGSLKKGDSFSQRLPGRVCAGVLRGKVQVQVLSKSRVAETLGPYALYCGS